MNPTEDFKKTRQEKIESLAREILCLARDSIVINMRFLDAALYKIAPVSRPGIGGAASDGKAMYYDPEYILRQYQEEPASSVRLYLHILFHFIFYHSYGYEKLNKADWDLAADLAVENTILERGLHAASMKGDGDGKAVLRQLGERAGGLTAQKLYRYFRKYPLSREERQELTGRFWRDSHIYWERTKDMTVTSEEWKKLSERIKADLKTFSKGRGKSKSLEQNLGEATRDRYDYKKILQKFAVMGEHMQLNDEEFDYIAYTYGLKIYGNLPLIEPLEHKEVKKIREFAVAIDTSASCRGSVVQAFVNKTYSILRETDNFFHKTNIHIIQCDSEIQSDTKITKPEDFDEFLKVGKLKGFGATDFRPVFTYVDRLVGEGEFENLKGLIYFTDGYGVYPEKMPDYEVIFVFLREDALRPQVPPWAIPVVLEAEEIEEWEDTQ